MTKDEPIMAALKFTLCAEIEKSMQKDYCTFCLDICTLVPLL